MIHRIRASWRRAVLAPTRRLIARWCLARGQVSLAESILRIAAVEAPRSFSTHLLWGRALLLLGEEDHAIDVLSRCYMLDAPRFLKQDLRTRIRDSVAMSCEWPEIFGKAPAASDDGDDPSASASGDPPPGRSDFVDGAEYRRFQSLPPLANTDLLDVDWDDLLERLARLPRTGETRESF